jgi:hypothetical protein
MKTIVYSLLALMLTFGSTNVSSQIVINEISYNAITPNSPGKLSGVEYLELYNDGIMPVNLVDWVIPQTARNGISYTFGNVTINAGEYLLLTNDSLGFQSVYNSSAREYVGYILNGGYRLELRDSFGNMQDSVSYDDIAPWPTLADGQGCSIELCDPTSDNAIASNWIRATNYFAIFNRRKVYGSPGVKNTTCSSTPIIQIQFREVSQSENDGEVTFDVYIDNTNGAAASVEVQAFNGTGDVATDITFTSPTIISFNGNADEKLPFTVEIISDTLNESEENIWFVLKNPSNGILANDTLELIIENAVPLLRQVKLAGILNVGGQASNPNLVEIVPLSDITDLSTYSLGCANNGGGTDGIEFQFPAVSVKKGQSYFVTRQPDVFKTFFGFEADFVDTAAGMGTSTATNFTGDDALELFENGRVIDRYGLPNVDGTGEAWEYMSSWAKRKVNTGPDGNNFVPTNWEYGGLGVLDDTLNDSCSNPYPLPKKQDTTVVNDTLSNAYLGNSNSEYSLYPNPAVNYINIKGLSASYKLMVIDLLGNVVLTTENSENELQLDLTEIENGVYYIRILKEGKQNSALKFIKTDNM